MHSWHEFITMGGYAAYVWSAYGLVLGSLVYNLVTPWRRQKKLLRQLSRTQEV